MTIFWRLVLSHLLADFTLQFNFVNSLKRKSVYGMLLHCFTHFFVSVALTWNTVGSVWFRLGPLEVNGWLALTLMFVVHFFIDEVRIYSMKHLSYRDGTVSFLVDQFLHIYVLFMISPMIYPGHGFLMPEKWIGVAVMLVLVSHVTTVLVYFIEKDMYDTQFPNFDVKYFLIFERLVLWAFFFVAGYWWTPFAAAWIFQIFYIRRKRIIDLSLLNIAFSVVLTVFFGFWTRYIYYGAI
ncbi:MAG: hypothetical protein A2X34_02825 [Elusimicrobia bacterium GWC2_51_8]|nr:MAG: hypothetical protein A2X33_03125 [Elusimicrobia bacterium GWA2_51_34]OGR58785.1 MAG: hypothetical protein A2X34_02825 [Elusimicrobia bacterium GWC2_51_8]OGR84826.1 MAG: hypothetical protein A2021_01275 [Elusimicrobia bacterium GWF2_52_66]HAF94870.1 hypothetical protein [Elusimicrobiota bacterium]HCE97172.1 hypothetical protein [Elusimicrobiota bacterium]